MNGAAARPESAPFLPLVGPPEGATVFRCGLCGARFTHGAMACASCPLHVGCDVVKCPECGYQFPRSSRLVEWAGKLARALKRVRR